MIVLIVATSGGDSDTELTSGADAPEESAGQDSGDDRATQVGMNQPARHGRFEFTVTSFECGTDTVGGEFLNKQAQGHFCLLGVTVENIGDEAQSLFADNQFLIDRQGREFSADSEATHLPRGRG